MDIEEDIKILNEYINIDRKMRNNNQESDYDKFCERQCIAIENLLAEREEDKKKIAELEAKLEFYQWGDLDNLKFEEYMKEFMPKQKVKEKIEENNKLIEKCKDELEHYGEIYLYEHDNKILKELLEEK